jgi:hypothetical protein
MQKRYDVYVGGVAAEARAAFEPHLNDEHREARWWPLDAGLPAAGLHPVVARPGPATICSGRMQRAHAQTRMVKRVVRDRRGQR